MHEQIHILLFVCTKPLTDMYSILQYACYVPSDVTYCMFWSLINKLL